MDLPELLSFIARHDKWVYGVLFAYCLGKTGPLPLLAGFVAVQGTLAIELVVLATVLGSMAGGQLRFTVGRFASPWLYRNLPRMAPWIALASAGVERYSLRTLLGYRFVKGLFSIVGLVAGASLLPWSKFLWLDTLSAALWISTMVGMGWIFGQLGAALDPRWAAYFGLGLLVIFILTLALLGRKIKAHLLPLAQKILQERLAQNSPSA